MNVTIETVGAVVGIAVPLFGAVFWFGRLEGRVSELNREMNEMKERQDKAETKIEKQAEKSGILSNEITKIGTGVDQLKDQVGALFSKMDKLTDAILTHFSNKEN